MKPETDEQKDKLLLIRDIKQEIYNIRETLDAFEADMNDNDDEEKQQKACILSIAFINSLENFPRITNDIIKSLKEIQNGH